MRQVLAHEAGLPVIEARVTPELMSEPGGVADVLARQRPLWEPGVRHGYHAYSLGWLEGEILRRTDPLGRTLGRYLADELAGPLGLDLYIGLPESVPDGRLAKLKAYGTPQLLYRMWGALPLGYVLRSLNPWSLTNRALGNPRVRSAADLDRREILALEIPSAGGVVNARSLAKAYGVFAAGGKEFGLRPETLEALAAPKPPPPGGARDKVLCVDTSFSMGFLKPYRPILFGSGPRAYGGPGAGGTFGFADPDARVGYAYVMNRMGFSMYDDPREKALRDALYRCLRG